ncbi:MAG: hypothetical protein Q7S10_00725 [bacterium]|nr:hypothetical protein [bacterium]
MQKETLMGSSENSGSKRVLPAILSVALIVAVGAAGYLYWQNFQLQKNPQVLAQEETQELVAKVSNLMVLPEGETPTIATVSDPEKLKDQPFFTKAVKGDKVLIYTNAKKAILYSPATNKIVEVAPINIGNAPAATAPSAQ